MWSKPYRPTHAVSQAYNDGVVAVYRVTDTAAPGAMPQIMLTPKVTLLYAERTIGSARYYAAEQAQARLDRVIRVQDPGPITTGEGAEAVTAPINAQDAAVTEDGIGYRIDRVTRIMDVYPATLELTLRRVDQIAEAAAS